MSNKKKKAAYRQKQTRSPWPLLLVVGGLLLIGGALFAAWRGASPKATPEVTGSPKLKVDQEKVDLGDVQLGQTVEVSFDLANVGDRPLYFTDLPYVEVVEGC